MQSSEELWEQSYEEIISTIPDLMSDDPFESFDVSSSPTRNSAPSLKVSCKGPKGGVGKPAVRRRSRSSKKAPTTLLTADANNFRALVQQFTGCHSGSPLLWAYKGPINLNFKQRNYYPENQQLQQQNFKVREESDRRFFPFGGKIDVADRARVAFDEDDGELFVSRIGQNPRNDLALTCDGDFDVRDDSFWGQEMMAGAGEYATVLSGAVDREFWGY